MEIWIEDRKILDEDEKTIIKIFNILWDMYGHKFNLRKALFEIRNIEEKIINLIGEQL